jgi:SAM-dependent methyltransferase
MDHVPADWFADEALWDATYPFLFSEARFAAAGAEVEHILALAGRRDGSVLDLACGPGRHSLPLAQRGFEVTGVDHSAVLIGRARERAAELDVAVEWLRADMRAFRRPASFDLALNLFTSFGFFRDDADNQRVLENVAASLKPGGVFVLDMAGKEVLARIFNATASTEIPDGLLVHRRTVVDDWSRLETEWIILQRGATQSYRFGHWIYSAREIVGMFRGAGFVDVQVYGDFTGAPYGPAASRLVVVGRTAGI